MVQQLQNTEILFNALSETYIQIICEYLDIRSFVMVRNFTSNRFKYIPKIIPLMFLALKDLGISSYLHSIMRKTLD